MGTRGPVPKRADQRRRRNATAPTTTVRPPTAPVAQPALGFPAHPVAEQWYASLAVSGQAYFYEPSDWAAAGLVAFDLTRHLIPRTVGGRRGRWLQMSTFGTADGSQRGRRYTGRRRRLGTAAMLVALLMTGSSCGDGVGGILQLGVTVAGSGAPELVVYPCPGEHVGKVTLWQLNKKRSDRERKLWSITSVSGTSGPISRFVVGQTPNGFTEETPLNGSIPTAVDLSIEVDLRGSASIDFQFGELRSDALVVQANLFDGHRHVSAATFEQVNAKRCRTS